MAVIKFKKYLKQVGVEVPIFFVYAAFLLEGSVSANLVSYRTCHVEFGFNETDCALLGTGNEEHSTILIETLVEPQTAVILMAKSILESAVPMFFCVFLGPWTDKFGRKPVLVSATFGYTIAYFIMWIVSVSPKISGWYLLVAYAPICLTGGFSSLYSAMLCYITDITNDDNRGFRLGLFDAFLNAGGLVGGLSTSFIFQRGGYISIYLLSASFCAISCLYLLVFVPESVGEIETQKKWSSLIKISVIKDIVVSAFQKRKHLGRSLILTSIFIQVLFYISYQSEFYILFLYLRERFHWSLGRFTTYNAINTILWIAGNMIGSYFLHEILHVHESYIILGGIISGIVGSTWQILATDNWHVYAGGCSKWLGGAVIPMSFSLLSKQILPEEFGKIMALVTALQTMGYLLAVPFYTWFYNNTYLVNPALFNFVTLGIYVTVVVLTVALLAMLKYQKRVVNLKTEPVPYIDKNNS